MTTILQGQNRIIKLHFKNDGKPLDLTNKLVLVNIKGNNSLNKVIERHDFAEEGLTHFILTSNETKKLDGDYITTFSIVDKQE
jgi:hypothetical protein